MVLKAEVMQLEEKQKYWRVCCEGKDIKVSLNCRELSEVLNMNISEVLKCFGTNYARRIQHQDVDSGVKCV